MKAALAAVLLLSILSLASAQLYDVYLVRTNDNNITNMVYDDMSWSYADNSMENPDASVRICTATPSDLQNKYVALAYADGSDGDYIQISSWPIQATSVSPSGCAFINLDLNSFYAWYPSIPYVFVANDATLSGASRWKLSKMRGWLIGNYTLTTSQIGNNVDITVTDALDDGGASILPDVDYLVVGLTRPDFTTMDTVITSVNNLNTLVSDGGNFTIYINGIGPDVPPYVNIITPQPITYDTQAIPFTFTITDDDGISACWYVLDGANTTLPDCMASYILNVGPGTHTLWLYANDSSGQMGSDSVTFVISGGAPPIVTPPGGGGGTQTPYWPTVPPTPPGVHMYISPEDIWVTVNYPYEGRTDFTITTDSAMSELECTVRSDFEDYTKVKLDSRLISADGKVRGTVIVSMPPTVILDYDQGMDGYLQCIGKSGPSLLSSAMANVHLIINKPLLTMDNRTFEAMPGELFNGTAPIRNIGEGNATVINVTAIALGRPYNVTIFSLPDQLGPGEQGYIRFGIGIPKDMPEGVSIIEVDFFENGRPIGRGYIIVRVLPAEVKPPPIIYCSVPDLGWTVIILLAGLIAAIITFKRKYRDEEDGEQRTGEEKPRYQFQGKA
jgi:hypothetical protein